MAVGDLEHAVCLTTSTRRSSSCVLPSGEDYRLNPVTATAGGLGADFARGLFVGDEQYMADESTRRRRAAASFVIRCRYATVRSETQQRGAERDSPDRRRRQGPNLSAGCSGSKAAARIAVSGIAPSADGTGYIVRLQNMAISVHSAFVWGRMKARRVSVCIYREQPRAVRRLLFWMKPLYRCSKSNRITQTTYEQTLLSLISLAACMTSRASP